MLIPAYENVQVATLSNTVVEYVKRKIGIDSRSTVHRLEILRKPRVYNFNFKV